MQLLGGIVTPSDKKGLVLATFLGDEPDEEVRVRCRQYQRGKGSVRHSRKSDAQLLIDHNNVNVP